MPRESAIAKRKREAPVAQKPLPVHEWRQVSRHIPFAQSLAPPPHALVAVRLTHCCAGLAGAQG